MTGQRLMSGGAMREKNDVSLKIQFSPKVNRGSLPQTPVIQNIQ